jgi:pyruvate formate lyase activating enzyme
MSMDLHYATPPPLEGGVENAALARSLDAHTTMGTVCRKENDHIRCLACSHRCRLAPNHRGICRLRFNQEGELRVPFGYVSSLACDPVEKKPFFHVLPGRSALTFGMLGCNLHCDFCQNWLISQALKDVNAGIEIRPTSPDQICRIARQNNARLVVSSYNEPLITAEWAGAIFEKARGEGLLCAMVSNGNATPEVLDFLQPWLAAFKVDLKCFQAGNYRSLGSTLAKVTWTIRALVERKIWTEVVTLLIPGFNDDEKELRDLVQFLVSVSPDIPWHITAFHPDYHRTHGVRTTAPMLLRAAEWGRDAGLRYVYPGNLPGDVGEWENTRCYHCGLTVVERCGFRVNAMKIEAPGKCPSCGTTIPGIWH